MRRIEKVLRLFMAVSAGIVVLFAIYEKDVGTAALSISLLVWIRMEWVAYEEMRRLDGLYTQHCLETLREKRSPEEL